MRTLAEWLLVRKVSDVGVGVAVLLQVWDFQSVTWALSVLGVCPLLGVSAQGGYCIQLHTATSHINIALVYQWVACPADYSQIGHFSWEKLCNSLNQSVGKKKALIAPGSVLAFGMLPMTTVQKPRCTYIEFQFVRLLLLHFCIVHTYNRAIEPSLTSLRWP